jgi:hypothetical protein
MSTYFDSFPLISYKFGEESEAVLFQDISTYVDVLDTAKDASAFYQKQSIYDYERPDTLSYKLYGTINYHWTFFYMNDNIRRSGWPVSYNQVFNLAKVSWPNQTLTTQANISVTFDVGTIITGSSSGAIGTIIARNLDLGQMIVRSDDTFVSGESVSYLDADTLTVSAVLGTAVPQYLSIHHYEDVDRNTVDIDPLNLVTTSLTSKTYLEYMVATNDDLKIINVLTPRAIAQVVGQWKSFMRNRDGA